MRTYSFIDRLNVNDLLF